MPVLALVAAAAWWAPTFGSRALADLGPGGSASADAGSPSASHAPGPAAGAPAPRRVPAGRPVRLDVASIDLHALVVPIDLAGTTLTPPPDPREVGWWRQGAPAGSATGTVLITGHTVHTGGGAMDALDQVRRGDRVVLTVRGFGIGYRVDRVQVLSKSALAQQAEDLFRQDGPGRLVLVTCEGWNGHDYESNVVVTARPLTGATG